MTQHSYKFFRNTDCKYFPCHGVDSDEHFNCLLCFCPLFWIPDCGGTPQWHEGIKDCTQCTKPHLPGGYDHTINRLKKQFEQIKNAQPPKTS